MTALERIRANFEAIKTSWEINKEGFPLTEQRKEKLNAFTGWGGCNAMILPLDRDWKKAGYSQELLKSEKEVKKGYKFLVSIFGDKKAQQIWEDVKNATLTSFYTPNSIPLTFFKELKEQNKEKNIEFLDPCAGAGVYVDSCLQHFPTANITAVEKDFLTSFLLKAKYKETPNVQVHSKAFEDVKFRNKFDIIASNIPFGDFKVAYPQYDKIFTDKIHNFFFYHSQNLLKEKGILSFITSTGVFNSFENKPIRENLLKEGFINSFKVLPNDTFENTAVTSHLICFVKDKENPKNALPNQNLFLENQLDENGVSLNKFILENPSVYIAEPKLGTNQYGKNEYTSKIGDFQECINQLKDDWKEISLKIETKTTHQQEVSELIPLDYPPIKNVASLNTKQTNLIEEISFLRKGTIPNDVENFKIIANIKGKYHQNTIPLVTIATAFDRKSKRKLYYFQSDVKNIQFTDLEEQWRSTDIFKSVKDILENLQQLSQEHQMHLVVDYRRDIDGKKFSDFFKENYKQVPLEHAYFKSEDIDFNFHREIQENDIFITKKGNVAQILEIQEISPDIDTEFPQKSESYKVRKIEIQPENQKIIIALLNLYSVYNLMIQQHHQYLNGVEWSQEHLEANKAKLNQTYDDFVNEFGQINSTQNKKILNEYKDLFKNYYYILTALENKTEEKIDPEQALEEGNIRVAYQKSGIFYYDYEKDFNQELTIEAGLVKSFSRFGKIVIDFIEKVTNKNQEEIISSLSDVLIYNPLNQEFELKETFLKGNIYHKKQAIEELPDSTAKEEALNFVNEYFPDRIPFHNIVYQMGSRWLPLEIYNDFLNSHFQATFKVEYEKESDTFFAIANQETINRDKWHRKKMGNGRFFDTHDIIKHAFYNTTPYIKKSEKYIDENGKEKTHFITLYEDTAECKRHIDNLRAYFMKYMLTLPHNKQEELTEIYNQKFNCSAKKIDAKYSFYKLGVDLEGLKSLGITKEYDHQIEGSWLAVSNNGGIIDHEVGYGKTLTLIATAHNLKKYGKAKLPLILGLPANVNELAKTYQKAYPEARILYAGKEEFSQGNGEEFFNKLRNNEYDVVIMSHTQLEKIPISDEIYLQEYEKEAQKVEANLKTAKLLNKDDITVSDIKRLEIKLQNLKADIEIFKYNIETGKNKNIPCLENLGIDHIIIDESHKFKNGSFSTRHNQVKGIGNTDGSKRADILRYAIRTIQRKNNSDFGATFFSGTPITNALAELYILQDYLTPKILEERGIANFDAWASTFIEKTTEIETNMVGNAVSTERFRRYMNMPQLSEMYNAMTHTRRGDNEVVKRPIQDVQSIVNELTPLQKKFNAKLVNFLATKGRNEGDLKLENPIKRDGGEVKALSLITTNLAWKASLDMRLINSSYPDDPNSKVNYMIESVLDRYKRYNEGLGTQIIFCSESTSKEKLSYAQMKYNYENNIFTSMYDDIKYKLISRGIPENQIAFVQDYKDDKSKAKLSKMMNEGKIRILIGGIINAGTGLNIQKRLCGVTHLTLPWTPAELEQGNGRIYRAGNEIVKTMNNNRCEIRMSATKGTLDIYKSEFLSRKAQFINQIREGASNKDVLVVDEGDLGGEDMALDMATLQAELSGDKTILEKAVVDKRLSEITQRIETTEKNHQIIKSKIETIKNDIANVERVLSSYQRDYQKATELVVYKGDKRVNKPVVETLPELSENYDEKIFAQYLKEKYKEVKGYSLGEILKVGELYGFDMIMERSFENVFCYIQSKEQPYRKYSYGIKETIDINGSDTAIANYFSNCIGSIKGKLNSQEKGLQKLQEKLENTERELKNEVVTDEMYQEQENLRDKQLEITAKLVASGGIRTHAEYQIKEEIINNQSVNVFRVTDDLKELERALLYDQFGKEGNTGFIYLKKDTQVYDLFVNRLNNNGIILNDEPLYNKELDEYFVSFQICDVDELYIKFSEIINPQPTLTKVDLDMIFQEEKQELIEVISSQKKEEPNIQNIVQLSLFDSFSDKERVSNKKLSSKQEIEEIPITYEEGENDIWECPKEYKDFPYIYDTETIEAKDRQVHRIFYIPGTSATWYLNELDKNTGDAFGLIAFQEVEWGYFSVKELLELGAKEVFLEYPKTYEELLETDLKNNLTKEELERAFYGQLTFEEDLWEKLPDEESTSTLEDSINEPRLNDDWSVDDDTLKQNGIKM